MNEELRQNADGCYGQAEQRAKDYFHSLSQKLTQKDYVPGLIHDIQTWKQDHLHHSLLNRFTRGKSNANSRGYYHYIQWLDYIGKLDQYLDRSISYIFMRDLGKDLNFPDTQHRIQNAVNGLKDYLKQADHQSELFSMAGLYRWAQKEGVESSLFWLIDKLKTVSKQIPKEMDAEEAKRKLIKLIAGVIMHQIEELGNQVSAEERARKLDIAIRLGYSYGLTYPFIDDLLDANILSDQEEERYSDIIRTTLVSGSVPDLGEWKGENKDLMQFVHAELREAFTYIKKHQRLETRTSFFEQAYVFFHSQEVDRDKDLSYAHYSNEELYIPVIIKSSSSRLIVRSVISAPEDEGFDRRTFYYGIYNQLADDFADMFDDMKEGRVTPYTYFLKYHDQRKDLINPFELYWTVIFNLIHNVYDSDPKTCEVILNRAINGLKRFKERMGVQMYNELMNLFTANISKLNKFVQKMVRKAEDVDFFDKLLRDHILTGLKNERIERQEFLDTIENVREQINELLSIAKTNSVMSEPISEAANYSLEGGGKRLRPIITWVMGVHEYGLEKTAIAPLLKSLEYMHNASLIFDDLPSQDDAAIRRGRRTLHEVYNTAIAELTGLFLTQKAVEEQTTLDAFDAKTVLSLIQYSSRITAEMCKGQAMDLGSKGKPLTLEQLNMMSYYKTGMAFEAALIMPAILAHVEEDEMNALKTFAYHAGIAFQIKDDLLDVEGNLIILGKPVGQDEENQNTTFVSILGREGARKAMWEHYCFASDALERIPKNTAFMKHLLDYLINRDH
ncbi:polyprenyl synthetase family protein [Salinibacillus xinjiangensis]|uniref:Polyprenyl synthetase family protein n=1 Tax=Salinibacillus xinjiangensis TaxID=1229268 RepID=A0A6G1X596_9BACI|nr:polyprenyl synthetase family protein [Salinibacillus xinjiangensis]MRG86050.1 polyprenyl synthetase family protein [Salinibacillus xinjiangensis]